MVGSIVVCCSLLILGFTKEIVGLAISDKEAARIPTIILAVVALYATDFSINAGTSSHARSSSTSLADLTTP
jgi:solute carrier family 45 protein 1/2/4